MSQYDAVAQRALAAIAKKGGPVTFPGQGSPGTYDPNTDTWSGGSEGDDVVGRAVKVDSDPDRFRELGLVLTNPITLMIAGAGLSVTPAPGKPMIWAGTQYTIKHVDDVNPDGTTPILYTVIGDA